MCLLCSRLRRSAVDTIKKSSNVFFSTYQDGVLSEKACKLSQLGGMALQDSTLPSLQRLYSARPQVDSFPHEKEGKVMHPDILNEKIKKTQYAVRGELYLRATQLEKEGLEITYTNVGNPQALGQKPLTFYRQKGGVVRTTWSCSLGLPCIK